MFKLTKTVSTYTYSTLQRPRFRYDQSGFLSQSHKWTKVQLIL